MRGRKKKYNSKEEFIIQRRFQNKLDKRRYRLKKKIALNLNKKLTDKEFELQYRTELINYFKSFEFDYYLTGTFAPISTPNISLQSLKSYTDRYIQLLFQEKLIERVVYFFENGNTNNNHTHMLIKSNQNIENTNIKIKQNWILGKIDLKKIEDENDKTNKLKYSLKEVETKTNKSSKLEKIDNWKFFGKF